MAPKAVLVGMPGSGKSTIGRRLAKAMGLPLLDTDAKIVETTGRSIADLFVEGEQEFRRVEENVVRTVLAEHDGIVSTRYHRGAFIERFDEATVLEHHELGGLLNGIASARAATNL